MPKSYRLRTQLGVDQTLQLNVEQDFDFLEILSMKLSQGDVYTRFCADYGVIVGRVVANGGFGVPNVRVSVFVPVDDEDLLNPVISALYPYKSPAEKNEDGYRYNLLPYNQEYGGHTPTGTFPTREDLLTRSEVLEIYEKYYKYTVKTNESGDFMIVGVPLGIQTLTMDLDLSNIGEFSLRPADLIRMGLATAEQFDGVQFRASEDLDSLPQIINAKKDVNVTSFWGDGSQCSIGITRADFDLRELGIEIQPTAVFMGSIMSSQDAQMLKKNCKPKTEQGDLCGMVTGPGEILAIRQTVNSDENGNPILEQFRLANGGKVIDEDGTFVCDVPMNLDYVVTNEYGELVYSRDPRIGIPTKGKYRFKIKYQSQQNGPLREGNTLIPIQGEIQRANFLVPNIREYGWTGATTTNPGVDPALYAKDNSPYYDPNYTGNTNWQLFQKSYAFSLDWNDYADKQAAINCEDFFYLMKYNKVYTTSQFIEDYRKGSGRARFLGIKEILDRSCESENNKFPVNDGVRNFDLLYFLFNILLTLLVPTIITLIFLSNIICILWPILRVIINVVGTVLLSALIILCNVVKALSFGLLKLNCPKWQLVNISETCPLTAIPLPNMSYPDCDMCNCESRDVVTQNDTTPSPNNSLLVNSTDYLFFEQVIGLNGSEVDTTWQSKYVYGFQSTMSGFDNGVDNSVWTKSPFMDDNNDDGNPYTNYKTWSWDLTLSERMNLFNVKAKYHADNAQNKVKVSVNPSSPLNSGKFHYDNVLVLLCDPESQDALQTGRVISFQNTANSADPNVSGGTTGTSITSTTYYATVNYMNPSNLSSNSATVYEITGSTNELKNKYLYPSDVEYYQVITASTIQDYIQLAGVSNIPTTYGFGNDKLINRFIFGYQRVSKGGGDNPDDYPDSSGTEKFKYNVPNFQLNAEYKNHIVVFLVRGVDMYTDRQDTIFDLSPLYGKSFGTGPIVRGNYKMNIPIQKYNSTSYKLTRHNLLANNGSNSDGYLFYGSYTFTVGTNYQTYTSKNHLDYSCLDSNNPKVGSGTAGSIGNFNTVNGALATKNSGNKMVNSTSSTGFKNGYKNNEIIEGGTMMLCNGGAGNPSRNDYFYFSPTYFTQYPTDTITMSNTTRMIMRSDRLPTSDTHDRRFVLHQNKNFAVYSITDSGLAEQITPTYNVSSDNSNEAADDFLEDAGSVAANIIQTFSCEGMVPLKCYTGDGENFGVAVTTDDCYYFDKEDDIKKIYGGCYYLVQRPAFSTIGKDITTFFEWRSRFRMMFALCRNVISLTFVNNWINGSLYMYSFQKDTLYLAPLSAATFNSDTTYRYCTDTIVFKETNNSFFYRSSPYNGNIFIGKTPPLNANDEMYGASNKRLLGSPTTMIDLGPRDQFIKEITFNPDYEGFIINKIPTSSYNDTSDILQLFVISRLADAGFWEQVLSAGDSSIGQLFSRSKQRLDGDITQLLSINSEFGVTPYLGDNYSQSQIKYYQTGQGPVLGVFFSANTQNRDLITPGRTTFADNTIVYLTNYYGFEDQQVPYWPWQIQNNSNLIFGSQINDWQIKNSVPSQIYTYKYQSVDRLLGGNIASGQPTFPSSVVTPTFERPGYIYNSSSTGGLNPTITPNSYLNPPPPAVGVGSPYHFYFGLRVGKSAMNKYINKYIFNEEIL